MAFHDEIGRHGQAVQGQAAEGGGGDGEGGGGDGGVCVGASARFRCMPASALRLWRARCAARRGRMDGPAKVQRARRG